MNPQQAQLLNSISEQCRHLKAEADEQKARLDNLVEQMNSFRTTAMEMLTEMSQAHAPKENNDSNN